jgi:hypothetical protein
MGCAKGSEWPRNFRDSVRHVAGLMLFQLVDEAVDVVHDLRRQLDANLGLGRHAAPVSEAGSCKS